MLFQSEAHDDSLSHRPTSRSKQKSVTSEDSPRNEHRIRRLISMFLTNEVLQETYEAILAEDPGVVTEALLAYDEMQIIPYDDLDEVGTDGLDEGLVQRRAPRNPLRSPLMGKFRKVKKDKKDKISDPALQKNPLRGRLIVAIMSTSASLFVFLQSLIVNKIQNREFHAPQKKNALLGPDPEILYNLGGLNANQIRKGELFRFFWSMWMHAGWLHIIFNVISQLQYLWMLEPDWGTIRTLLLFFISGITGNLLAAFCDPCSTTVGSSAALFGLMGAMFPYCLEYWKSIPRPGLIIVFSMVVLSISILAGFTGITNNWAHMGGIIGGFLFGMGTLTTLTACEDIESRRFVPWLKKHEHHLMNTPQEATKMKGMIVGPDGKQRKKIVKRNPVARVFQKKVRPTCKCGLREWVVRSISLILLLIIWILLFRNVLLPHEFQPPGQVTYKTVRACCCCFYDDGTSLYRKEIWTCNYCDAPVNGAKILWKDKCQLRTRIQKSESELNVALDSILEKTTNFTDGSSRTTSKFLPRGLIHLNPGNILNQKFYTPLRFFEEKNQSILSSYGTLFNSSDETQMLQKMVNSEFLSQPVRTKIATVIDVLESKRKEDLGNIITPQLNEILLTLIDSIDEYINNGSIMETSEILINDDNKNGENSRREKIYNSVLSYPSTFEALKLPTKVFNNELSINQNNGVFQHWESI